MKVKHAASVVFALLISVVAIYFEATTDYDWQSIKLALLRVTVWVLFVLFYTKVKSLFEDDDDEEDWARINAGNVAVSVYRGLELLGVCIAASMLVWQI